MRDPFGRFLKQEKDMKLCVEIDKTKQAIRDFAKSKKMDGGDDPKANYHGTDRHENTDDDSSSTSDGSSVDSSTFNGSSVQSSTVDENSLV